MHQFPSHIPKSVVLFEQNSSLVGCIHQKYLPKSVASIWYYPGVFKSSACEGEFNLINTFCWYETRVFLVYTEASTMRIGEAGFEQFSKVISFRVTDAIFPRRMYFSSATGRCLVSHYLWRKIEIGMFYFSPNSLLTFYPTNV